MKNLPLLIFVLLSFNLSAQELLFENFSGVTIPPEGWAINNANSNWNLYEKNKCGKSAPELQFVFQPIFNGTSAFISPELSSSGQKGLRVEFSFALHHHNEDYTLGVAVINDGDTADVWNIEPDTSLKDNWKSILIDKSLADGDFKVCWYFNGYSYNIYNWHIDDIRIYHPYENDLAAIFIEPEKEQYQTGENILLNGSIFNPGISNQQDGQYEINIYLDEENVFSRTENISIQPDTAFSFQLDSFIPTEENKVYDVELIAIAENDDYNFNDTAFAILNTYTTARQFVLIEEATGTWCGTCPGAALGIDDLVANGKLVAPVAYHVADDYENEAGFFRLIYYQIPAYPTAIFDGIEKITQGHQFLSMYETYLPVYEKKIQINSPGNLNIYGESSGNTYEIDVEVDLQADIRSENLQLYLVLTESHIPEIWGGGGMEEVNHVERLILPDKYGLSIENEEGQYLYDFYFEMDESWVKENSELIAFIQDTMSFEVYQAGKVKLNELIPMNIQSTLNDKEPQIYPNPCKDHFNIRLQKNDKIQKVRLINAIGKLVRTWPGNQNNCMRLDLVNSHQNKIDEGLFFLEITYEEGIMLEKVLIK